MSEQPGRENLEDDIGSYSVDDEDQLSADDTLIDDQGEEGGAWSPPDMQPRATEWGTTAWEQAQDETIDQRIMQEVPDADSEQDADEDA